MSDLSDLSRRTRIALTVLMLPVHIAVWVLERASFIVLWVIGAPLIVWHARKAHYHTAMSRTRRPATRILAWDRAYMYLWGNDEDGISGPVDYWASHPSWTMRRTIIMWSLVRNPVNNRRFVGPFGFRARHWLILACGNCSGSPQDDWVLHEPRRRLWSWTWQGIYSGLWVRIPTQRRLRGTKRILTLFARVIELPWLMWEDGDSFINIRAGWKLIPRDEWGIPKSDYRHYGIGAGFQLQWERDQ